MFNRKLIFLKPRLNQNQHRGGTCALSGMINSTKMIIEYMTAYTSCHEFHSLASTCISTVAIPHHELGMGQNLRPDRDFW